MGRPRGKFLARGARWAERGAVAYTVTFWGTRGSIPTPGAHTARYGGNTSCVAVSGAPDQLVILDQGEIKAAGSMAGLRKALAKRVELRFLDPLNPAQEAALGELGTVLEARNGLYDLELVEADPAGAFRWAEGQGTTLVQVTPRHDRLDEVLLRALHPVMGN